MLVAFVTHQYTISLCKHFSENSRQIKIQSCFEKCPIVFVYQVNMFDEPKQYICDRDKFRSTNICSTFLQASITIFTSEILSKYFIQSRVKIYPNQQFSIEWFTNIFYERVHKRFGLIFFTLCRKIILKQLLL